MALIFSTLSALKAGLVSWLAENSIDSQTLDRAVALVEADMRRKLRVFQMEITTDLPLTGETLTVPSRFLATRRLYIPGYRALTYLSPELLIDDQVDNPTQGRPRHYTQEGREDALPYFRFSPTPDQEYTLRLTYMADMGLLSDDDCNSILDLYPDAYFYGCLSHLGDFVRNKERLPEWSARYDGIIQQIISADLRDKVDGSSITPRSVYRRH